jgi:hypothetical protein
MSYAEMTQFISADAKQYREREAAILKSNENFIAHSEEQIVLCQELPDDGPIPTHAKVSFGEKHVEIPLLQKPATEFSAQSFLDKPVFGKTVNVMGSNVVVYLTSRQVAQVAHQFVTHIPSTSYEFVYRSTSESVEKLKSLSRITRETAYNTWMDLCEIWMLWLISYCVVFYCRIMDKTPPAFCRRRVHRSNISNIIKIMTFLTQVAAIYGAIKLSTKAYHWAFTPLMESQSIYKHDNLRTKPGNRTVNRFVKNASNKYSLGGYGAQGMDDDNYVMNINSIACKITIKSIDGTHSQRGLCVNAGAVLCTVHFIKYLETTLPECEMDTPPVLTIESNNLRRDIPLSLVKWAYASPEMGMDIGMLNLSNLIPAKKSIVSYFVREQDVTELKLRGSKMLTTRASTRGFLSVESVTLDNPRYVEESLAYATGSDIYYAHRAFMYDNFSQNGMCGSVMVHDDRATVGSIIGIHVAGHPSNGVGFSQLVTREVIEELLDSLGIDFKRVEMPEYGPLSDSQKERFAQYEDIEFFGQMNTSKGVRMADKTQLEESCVFDKFAVHTTIPAMLKPENGISPIHEALKKSNKTSGCYDEKVLKVIFSEMDHMYSLLPTMSYDRILTYKETANGLRGTNHLKPLDISASCGYPYVLTRKRKGKKDQFNHIRDKDGETLYYDKAFFSEVQKYEEMLNNKEVPFFLFTASLKDERRPIEKALSGKTRMFSAGNIMLLVLCRRYFGGFLAFLTANSGELGSKVGSDLAGKDFDKIYRYCGRNRTADEMQSNWLHGDFTSYDVTLMSCLVSGFFESAIKWYDRSKRMILIMNDIIEFDNLLQEHSMGRFTFWGERYFLLARGIRVAILLLYILMDLQMRSLIDISIIN